MKGAGQVNGGAVVGVLRRNMLRGVWVRDGAV